MKIPVLLDTFNFIDLIKEENIEKLKFLLSLKQEGKFKFPLDFFALHEFMNKNYSEEEIFKRAKFLDNLCGKDIIMPTINEKNKIKCNISRNGAMDILIPDEFKKNYGRSDLCIVTEIRKFAGENDLNDLDKLREVICDIANPKGGNKPELLHHTIVHCVTKNARKYFLNNKKNKRVNYNKQNKLFMKEYMNCILNSYEVAMSFMLSTNGKDVFTNKTKKNYKIFREATLDFVNRISKKSNKFIESNIEWAQENNRVHEFLYVMRQQEKYNEACKYPNVEKKVNGMTFAEWLDRNLKGETGLGSGKNSSPKSNDVADFMRMNFIYENGFVMMDSEFFDIMNPVSVKKKYGKIFKNYDPKAIMCTSLETRNGQKGLIEHLKERLKLKKHSHN